MVDIRDISDQATLHTLVLRLRRGAVELLAARTTDPGFGPLEIVLLRVLRSGPRDTDSIRGLAALDMVTFSKSIRRLQRSGFVECYAGTHDRRRRLYALTDAGVGAEKRATLASIATERALLDPLAPRDRSLFMRLLTKLTLAHAVNGAVAQDPRIVAVLGGAIDPGTLLRRALQISAQFFDQHCGEFKLSPLEVAAVQGIGHFGPMAIKELPRVLSIDRGSAFAIVAKLRSNGLLDDVAHDRRELALGRQGVALRDRLVACTGALEDQFLGVLGKAERPRFARVMRKLFVALVAEPSPGRTASNQGQAI